MNRVSNFLRSTGALLCVLAITSGAFPPAQAFAESADPAGRALALLNDRPCAARFASEDDAPYQVAQDTTASPSPSPSPSPSFAPVPYSPGKVYATPFATATPPGVTPPPVPTPTPASTGSPGPVFLTRPTGAPPTIAPAGPAGKPTPSPAPSAEPTLQPGYVAVMADKVVGNANPGQPGDAIGNVNIFYQDEVIVGDRAHYDGTHTITLSGNPYIINRTKDTILYADTITFDTIAQTAALSNGRGKSSQGVEKGLVYYSATNLHSTNTGVAHGDNAYMTTCEHARGGYHLTGKTIDVTPGDKIVITKAILWLGAAAVFFIPRIVIPLRTVQDERQRPTFFPDIGYNADEGYYVKTRLGFGKDQYYYGYYRLEYYTKVGLGLGYVAFFGKRNGRRQADVDFFRKVDRRIQSVLYNVKADETENISRTLRASAAYTYNSNFGPLTNLPPNTSYNVGLQHAGQQESQSYSFSRSQVTGQSKSDNYGFTDTHTFSPVLSNTSSFTLGHNESSYGGFFSSNSSAHVNDLLHWAARGVDYQVTYDKNFSQQPFGIDKVPEIEVRPNAFFQHFVFPLALSLTAGQYTEPQNGFSTSRGDLAMTMGPALYHVLRSDFSAGLTVHQYAYATGDLKASVNQQASLSTIFNNHFTNALTYTESNYNGPAFVPFQTIDQQSTTNYHTAQDVLHILNQDYYNLQLTFQTSFNVMAQPIGYQFTSRPSRRSYLVLGGSYVPGPGNGFLPTNFQVITPFGRGSTLEILGDIDWKSKGQIRDKNIYYTHIVGDCYQIAMQYNQSLRQINFNVNILAFPSRSAGITLGGNAPLIPGSLNF